MIKLLATYGEKKSGDIVKLSSEQEEKLIEKGFAIKYETEEIQITDLSQEKQEEERETVTIVFADGTSEILEVYTPKELKALGVEKQKEILKQMGEDPEEEEFSNADKRIAFIVNIYKENTK